VTVLAGQLGVLGSATRREPAAWTPDQVANIKGWYAADGLPTGALGSWPDLSAANNPLVQASSGERPTVTANVLNGLPVVRFDGGDQVAASGTYDLSGKSFTWFVVHVQRATTAYGMVVVYASNIGYELRHDSNSSRYQVVTNGGSGVVVPGIGAPSVGTPRLATLRFSDPENQTALWEDGTLAVSPTDNSTISGSLPKTLHVGGRTDGYHYNGDVAELVLFDTALSTDDRQKVEGYLAHKWGQTAALPGGHPYKTEAP
jgi:hypothetical protein